MSLDKEQVVEYLSGMPVMELAELITTLEDKWGVSAAAAAVAVAAPGAGGEAAEEQTEFDVVLAGAGGNKIAVIKEVRGLTGLGLKEAKELVEAAPKAIKEGIAKDEAEKVKEALEKAGATVEIK